MCCKCRCDCPPGGPYLDRSITIPKTPSTKYLREVLYYVETDEWGLQGPFESKERAQNFAERQEYGDVVCFIDGSKVRTRWGSAECLR